MSRAKRDVVGLDGALGRLAQQSYGPALLALVAAGLIAYGGWAMLVAPDYDLDEV